MNRLQPVEYWKKMSCEWIDGNEICTEPLTTKIANALVCRKYTLLLPSPYGPIEISTEPMSNMCIP